jgi:type I restriction enzyme S subunit
MAKVSIGELIETGVIIAHKDGNYGSLYPRTSEFGKEGVPFLTAKIVSDDGRIDFDQASRLNCQKANQFGFGWIEKDDVLLSHNATVGRVALVPEIKEKMLVGTSLTYFRLDKERLLPSYLATYMASKEFQDQLASVMSYSTRNQVPITIQRDLFVDVPCLADQKFIGDVFESFSRKIELNRKINETLEGIAKALFKSWFVDFDPVRAKAEGRPTGLPDEISELFPDSFEESELGEIPSGWSTSQIGSRLETFLGGTPSRKKHEYWGGAIPWIGSGMVNEFRVIKATEMITEEGLANSATKMLPRGSTLIAITGATLGKVSMNEIEVCANQSVVAINPSTSLGAEYVFLWVKSNIDFLINCQTGGAQQHVNKNDVNNMPLLLPPPRILERFSDIAAPVFKKIAGGLFEQESLSSIRDLLLPRLISGELRVPDAEKMLEEIGI